MPEGIRINQITAGHAKEFHEKLKARGMATTTIHKRIQFARQFMHDAVDKLMKKANSVCQVILGLSRYPVFLNHRTHRTHRNESSPRHVIFPCVRCVPWFPALRGQERIRGRGSPVSSGSQHSDGLEELESTHRNDSTTTTRRSLWLATIVPFDASQ